MVSYLQVTSLFQTLVISSSEEYPFESDMVNSVLGSLVNISSSLDVLMVTNSQKLNILKNVVLSCASLCFMDPKNSIALLTLW